MARRTRCSDAGYVYHVLNRAVGRATIFEKAADYAAFKRILAQEILRGRIYLFCPNSPAGPHRPDRLRGSARQAGSIPRENTVRNHFLTLCRYAERNRCRQPGDTRRALAVLQVQSSLRMDQSGPFCLTRRDRRTRRLSPRQRRSVSEGMPRLPCGLARLARIQRYDFPCWG